MTTMECNDYTGIPAFLKQVEQALQSEICEIDLTKLEFLNSSGTRMIASFMLRNPRYFQIRMNRQIPWQRYVVPRFQDLGPERIAIMAAPLQGEEGI